MRRSNMIRWPVSCIVQVCRYSAANAPTRMATYTQRQTIEAVELAGRDVPIDRDLDQVRLRQRRAGADQNGDKRHRHLSPVGHQVGEQPTHQPRVVGFAENLVVQNCILG